MLGDAGEHASQISLRIQAIELGCADQSVDGRPFLASVGAGRQVVLTVERYRPQRALDCVVVDFQTAIVPRSGLAP